MIVPKYFEDFDHLHVNTMPNRAYYIPASRRMEDLVENREASDRFFLLSGDWKFRYFTSVYDVKEEFFRRRDTTLLHSRRFRCRPSGRIMAMTTISIRMSATRSRWIRRMCRMRTRAVRT